jgi:hypothetical protein
MHAGGAVAAKWQIASVSVPWLRHEMPGDARREVPAGDISAEPRY